MATVSLLSILATAQSTCGSFVPNGQIALGEVTDCILGDPSGPSGGNPCSGTFAAILGPNADIISISAGDNTCDSDYSNGWVVGCDSNGVPTLVVQNNVEYYTCTPSEANCVVTFGGLSSSYYDRTYLCSPGS